MTFHCLHLNLEVIVFGHKHLKTDSLTKLLLWMISFSGVSTVFTCLLYVFLPTLSLFSPYLPISPP